MTLDGAIEQYTKKLKYYKDAQANNSNEYSCDILYQEEQQCRQLIEWLKDYKKLLENQSTIEDKIVDKLVRFKGNSGCDYTANCIIDTCIGIVRNYFKEIING